MTRDKKLITIFTLVAALSAGFVGNHLATAKGPPVQTIDAQVDAGVDGLSVQFVGDTMLGDGAQPMLNRWGYDSPFRPRVRAALNGDFVVANVEGAFTHITQPFNRGKDYSYAINPAAVAAIQRAGVDAVDLDNNHAMDAGPQGLKDAFAFLHVAEMPGFGAGANLKRAEQPLLLHSKAGTVGIVGLGENFGSSIRADDAQAGTVVLSPKTVQRGVDLARAAGADWVIAFVHWGDNYMPVNSQQRYWGRMLVKAGYDLVVGSGPHIAQPIEFFRGVPIVYSLGNFVFGAPGRFDGFGVPGLGLMVKADLSKTEGITLHVRCLVTDNNFVHYRPKMCAPKRSRHFLPKLIPGIVMEGNGGFIQAPAHRKAHGS